jgi:hypothetical protein
MADVTFGFTAPEIKHPGWKPNSQAPVNNDQKLETKLTRAAGSVTNNPAATIPVPTGATPPSPTVSNNTEAKMQASGGRPVSNDHGHYFGITTRGFKKEGEEPQTIPSADVQILRTNGQPITNDGRPGVIHQGPEPRTQNQKKEHQYAAGAPMSNETSVTFAPAPMKTRHFSTSNPDASNQPGSGSPIDNGDVSFGASAGSVGNSVENQPTGQGPVQYPDTDRSIGGGGHIQRIAGTEHVQIGSKGKTVRT